MYKYSSHSPVTSIHMPITASYSRHE